MILLGLVASLGGGAAAVAPGAGIWEEGRLRPPAGLVLGPLACGGWTFPLGVVYPPASGVLAVIAALGAGRTRVARTAVVLGLLGAGAAPWLLLLVSGALG